MAKGDAQLKVKKKKWFSVLAPKIFKEIVIGEIPLYEIDQLNKRCLTVNMMNLTNNPKSQHISVRLRVNEVKDNKGFTEILGFETMPSSIKRLVRRGKTKIEDSFVVLTSDKKIVRIKPLMITNSVISNRVAATIRKAVRNNVARLVPKMSYEKLIEEILTFKMQKHIQGLASKVSPVRNCEMKAFVLVERPGVKPFVPTKDGDLPIKDKEETYQEEEAQEEVVDQVAEIESAKENKEE